MQMETVPEKKVVKEVPLELTLEQIDKGQGMIQSNATLIYAVRKIVAHVNGSKNPEIKCKATVTIKVTIAHDAQGYTVVMQPEAKVPAPLPKWDFLKPIETENGKPTLGRGQVEDDTGDLPFEEQE